MLGYSLRLGEDSVRLLPVTNPDTKAFDYKTYDRVVRQFSGRSPTEFKVMQRQELLAARMRDLVRARVRVGDDEAFTAYQREKATATIRFVDLPARLVRPPRARSRRRRPSKPGPKSTRTRSTASSSRANRSTCPSAGRARHILVKVPDGATDEQKAAASHKTEAILERVKGGEDFAKVAREESDDARRPRGAISAASSAAAWSSPSKTPRSRSLRARFRRVVETQFGFHVIKLEGIYKDAEAEAEGRRRPPSR